MPREGFLGLFDIANRGDFERNALSYLQDHPECICEVDGLGCTLLHEAASQNSLLVMHKIISIARDKFKDEAKFAAYIETKDCLGWTPLFTAVARENWLAALFLKDQGANVMASNIYGQSILFYMMRNEDWISALILIQNSDGQDFPLMNRPDKYRGTPLSLAVDQQFDHILWALAFLGYRGVRRLIRGLEQPINRRGVELFCGQVQEFIGLKLLPLITADKGKSSMISESLRALLVKARNFQIFVAKELQKLRDEDTKLKIKKLEDTKLKVEELEDTLIQLQREISLSVFGHSDSIPVALGSSSSKTGCGGGEDGGTKRDDGEDKDDGEEAVFEKICAVFPKCDKFPEAIEDDIVDEAEAIDEPCEVILGAKPFNSFT